MRCRIFTTRNGKIMASLYIYDPKENKVYKLVIFNKTLESVIHIVRNTFAPIVYRKSSKGSDIIFEAAISLDNFWLAKGVNSSVSV